MNDSSHGRGRINWHIHFLATRTGSVRSIRRLCFLQIRTKAQLLCCIIFILVAQCEGTTSINGKIVLGRQKWQHAQLLWNTSTDTDTDADGTIITKPYIPRGRSKCAASFIPSSPAFFIRNHAIIIAKKYVCDNGPAFFIPPRSHCLFLGSHAYNIDMVDTTPVVVPAATPTNLIPRSRHWINDEILNQEHIIQLGMDSSGATVSTQEEEASSRPSPTTVTTIHRNKAGTAIAVEVASAITLNHVASIRALSNGIQEVVSTCSSPDNNGSSSRLCQHFEHRSFGDGQGGNDCTYLAPFIQALCPHVMMTVKDIATLAWKAASWDVDEHTHHPDPMSLGIRTSEYLSYEGWPSLEAHKDVGSIYTIMIAIKDPQEYDGGEFFIQNSMLDSTNVKLEKLSAIVFKSDTIHGVRTITSGHRESFVTELWLNNDSPIGVCRPTEDQWESFLETTS